MSGTSNITSNYSDEDCGCPEAATSPALGSTPYAASTSHGGKGVCDSSIENGKIAGRADTKITEEYIIVQLKRQDELTRRIQCRRAKAAKRSQKGMQVVTKADAA
jgi:uncharacterized protein CbrC (UPF0167 family)